MRRAHQVINSDLIINSQLGIHPQFEEVDTEYYPNEGVSPLHVSDQTTTGYSVHSYQPEIPEISSSLVTPIPQSREDFALNSEPSLNLARGLDKIILAETEPRIFPLGHARDMDNFGRIQGIQPPTDGRQMMLSEYGYLREPLGVEPAGVPSFAYPTINTDNTFGSIRYQSSLQELLDELDAMILRGDYPSSVQLTRYDSQWYADRRHSRTGSHSRDTDEVSFLNLYQLAPISPDKATLASNQHIPEAPLASMFEHVASGDPGRILEGSTPNQPPEVICFWDTPSVTAPSSGNKNWISRSMFIGFGKNTLQMHAFTKMILPRPAETSKEHVRTTSPSALRTASMYTYGDFLVPEGFVHPRTTAHVLYLEYLLLKLPNDIIFVETDPGIILTISNSLFHITEHYVEDHTTPHYVITHSNSWGAVKTSIINGIQWWQSYFPLELGKTMNRVYVYIQTLRYLLMCKILLIAESEAFGGERWTEHPDPTSKFATRAAEFMYWVGCIVYLYREKCGYGNAVEFDPTLNGGGGGFLH
ncbi:hypothetical protein DFH27DRAFT_610390 [Peziza echinospora]|nr:hypothetical protein DFH27DRAFT_610390 [Peziza echinospora]